MKSLLYFLLFSIPFFAQSPIDSILIKYNKKTVPYITTTELKALKNPIILDTREQKEFNVSHIKNAFCVGYDNYNSKIVKEKYKNLNDTIIVYCSVGVRSENIGNKLKKMGYKNVYNLYGGIFGWKNHDEEVVDINQVSTEKVHTYSIEWSNFLIKGKKVY